MKKIFFAALSVLFLAGCAHQQSETYGYAGLSYLGDCAYGDLCGPGLYDTYFYYYPYYPSGPAVPERMRVSLVTHPLAPHFGSPSGGRPGNSSPSGSGDGGWTGSGSSVSTAPATIDRSTPAPAPAPGPVHTVSPRN